MITINDILDILNEIKAKDRNRPVFLSTAGAVKSFEWMDVAEGFILFIDAEEET